MAGFFRNLFGKSQKGPKHVLSSLQQNNLKKFDECLRSPGFDVNKCTPEYNSLSTDPWTLLMRIAHDYDSKFLLYLLDFKPDINQCSEKEGQTALMLAVINGKIDNVRNLCIFNCDKNVLDKTYDGFSALHYACKYGNVEIVKVLIGNIGQKVDVNIRSNFNKTPFQIAKSYNHKTVCSLLEEELKNRSSTVENSRKTGKNPHNVATTSAHNDISSKKTQSQVPTEHWDNYDSMKENLNSNKRTSMVSNTQPSSNNGHSTNQNATPTGSFVSLGNSTNQNATPTGSFVTEQGLVVKGNNEYAMSQTEHAIPQQQKQIQGVHPQQPQRTLSQQHQASLQCYNRDSGYYAASKGKYSILTWDKQLRHLFDQRPFVYKQII